MVYFLFDSFEHVCYIPVGDYFSAGTAICEVETDKATVTYEAQEDGEWDRFNKSPFICFLICFFTGFVFI